MFRIGTDIIRISRIEKSLEKESFKLSVFTDNEILYSKKAETFAGIFAAKEAYLKAKGTGINKRLNSIEIMKRGSHISAGLNTRMFQSAMMAIMP